MRKVGFLILLLLSQAGLVGAAAPNPQWPSVAEQLQKDHVEPGSALEQLIRNHQDFDILRPDEAKDDRGIPPWLRVFWREAHPELTYRADDPSGGYPLVLKDIYVWMIHHQDLVAGELQEEAAPEEDLTIGSNQRISGLQISPRSESDIRINFWNPNQIIAASNEIETSAMLALFYSGDGGVTWGQTSLPLMPGDAFQGDPAVDWTSNGTAWATSLGIVSTLSDVKVKAYKSTNGGATWTYDATVSGTQATADKEMLWSDHSATSPFKDNLYVVWQFQGHTYLNRRAAGSWGTPISILASTFSSYQGADVKANAFGDVFVLWPGTDNGASSIPNRIFVNKSTDGGQTFQTAITVGRTYGLFQYSIPAQARRKVLISPSGGAYRTSVKNLVYASWHDLTGAAGCTSNANAPGTNTSSTCKSRIWFARSTDGGATWSAPVMVNNQSSLNDQFFPHLAVDETSGVVSIVYYDTISDPGRLKTDFWYQSSLDDGVTWSLATKVTTAQTDETVSGADLGNQYGDYTGMSAYSGLFLPSWTDRRTNAREEIWTAKIQDGAAPPVKNAQFLSQSGVPATMIAGNLYPVSVTVKNSGTVTWSPIGPQCNAYRLAQIGSPGWSPTRVDLPAPVAPGVSVTLNFNVVAPSAVGTYNFQLQMVHECVEFFGDLSPNVQVSVQNPPSARFNFTCTNVSCSFDANSSTDDHGIASYSWSFGDSTSGFGVTTSHSFATGSYTVTLTVADTDGLLSSMSKKVSVTDEIPGAAEGFFTVPPCRIADTRTTTPLTSNVQQLFQVTGLCGIPASAKAVSFNVTVVSPTGPGHLVFLPGNQTFGPFAHSTINFDPANSPRANNANLRLATNGAGSVNISPYVAASPGQVHVILDVYGYFSEDTTPAPGAQGPFGFQTLTPCRIADTRTSTPIPVNTTRNFTVQGTCGVPSGAAAAPLNLTIISPTAGGLASLFQAGVFPEVPVINFNAGVVLTNGARIRLAPTTPDVSVNYYSPIAGAQSTHATIDVFGYFKSDAPLKYRPITACRAVDTRFADQGGPVLASPDTRNFQIRGNCGVPLSAKAVAVNITSVGSAGGGYLVAYPSGGTLPSASYLNFDPGQGALANGGIVALSTQPNDLAITTATSTHVIIDVFGYFQ